MKTTPILLAAGLTAALSACATKTVEGPVTTYYTAPAPTHNTSPGTKTKPKPQPTPAPEPTPDPLAPAPIPQKRGTPGVSPLSHGADQPLYQRTP